MKLKPVVAGTIVGFLLIGASWVKLADAREGALTAQDARAQINLRENANTNSARLGFGLAGDRVSILSETRGEDGYTWYRVQFHKTGVLGWIRSDFVKIFNTPSGLPFDSATLTAKDVNAQVNLRESASATARLLGYGLVNDRVRISTQQPGGDGFNWYRVQFNRSGAEGWIRSDFINFNQDILWRCRCQPKDDRNDCGQTRSKPNSFSLMSRVDPSSGEYRCSVY